MEMERDWKLRDGHGEGWELEMKGSGGGKGKWRWEVEMGKVGGEKGKGMDGDGKDIGGNKKGIRRGKGEGNQVGTMCQGIGCGC